MRENLESFMEGTEGHGHVPDCGFAVCCLEEVLPEVARGRRGQIAGGGCVCRKNEPLLRSWSSSRTLVFWQKNSWPQLRL